MEHALKSDRPEAPDSIAAAAASAATGGATVRDIARAAGVSTGTVSRALKNETGLTETTRQSVLATARRLGYDFGKLRAKRIRRLSFLAAGPADGLPDQVRMHAPDGIVCAGFFEPELLSALRATGKPLVLIDMKLRGYSSVNPDNLAGGQLATRHLIALGRHRIALIAGPLGHYSIRERARGYRQALFDAGMLADPALEAHLPDGADLDAGAREAMQSLLELPERPD